MNAAPLTLPEAQWAQLRAAYAEPPRAYHHFGHVEAVLAHYAEVAADTGWRQPREVYLAVLYHDAVYRAGRGDNEAQSARLAEAAIAQWLPDAGVEATRVAALIELTARHGQLTVASVDADAALFLDCDMAILGAAPEAFAAYDRAIAEEYRGVVPGWLYRRKRRAFLRTVLAQPRIFLSERFHARYDAAARANLRHAIG
ncbi:MULTISPECIES: hypothetical protein [Xanthomonas]|uniref:N-methyl-D-aspartate receptor NMDAR2C subunit n=1 Tax=Xanthomonas sontii TaxID=2650745 RepID=A0A6N7Q899_9XANT|nr:MULTISPECIES: hypothetical protein [Xanthomonas]KAB7770636.1 hypothetical protein CEK68_02515 [Xanthomonas sp. LMG 12461]MCW0404222.1 hypothetical protein [Xanthomonas sacchari]MCW0415596.1 hypothetical protein [Xanthomonas sacchari]MRH00504.1 hypothetical protein [Xanthomonas sontii]MRH74836.1 hypothetical protein [Xanthomonas sontii]